MNLRWTLSLLVLAWTLTAGCTGPQSPVEVYHYRDLVREGKVEHLEELSQALASSDESVRGAAIRSMAELGPVAIPRLKQLVREESKAAGPALLALGMTGDAEVVGFIRQYANHPLLGAPAAEAEKTLEASLYARVKQGDLEAMEAYLEAFPDSPKSEDIREQRRNLLAKQAFERARSTGSMEELEAFLNQYADSADAPKVRVLLARMMIKEGAERLNAGDYEGARQMVARVPTIDPRRAQEAKRIIARSHLEQGRKLKEAGETNEALEHLAKAAEFSEFRVEANRIQADILVTEAHKNLEASKVQEAVLLLNRAAELDASRRDEIAGIKADLVAKFQAAIDSDDPVVRKQGLVGMVSLGDEAVKPLELYLGTLFARRDYAKVEELVGALAEARRAVPEGETNRGIERTTALLLNYLKVSLEASTGEVIRLFGSSDYLRYWKPEIDPVDPRQYPLIFKVEGTTTRHLGLSRIALAAKALLGASTLQIAQGKLLPDDEVMARIGRGDIGNDPSEGLLTRVQLCARYSSILADFDRLVTEDRDRFLAYAVGLSVPPFTTTDWLTVAEGFKRAVANAGPDGRPDIETSRGGLRTNDTSLISADYDRSSLTVLLYDPVVDRLGSKTETARAEAAQRTLAVLMNTARIAFGLYAGVDRYTVMIGSTERSQSADSRVRGGQFNPETRMMLSRKHFDKVDWAAIRKLNGTYSARELELVDLRWFRWKP